MPLAYRLTGVCMNTVRELTNDEIMSVSGAAASFTVQWAHISPTVWVGQASCGTGYIIKWAGDGANGIPNGAVITSTVGDVENAANWGCAPGTPSPTDHVFGAYGFATGSDPNALGAGGDEVFNMKGGATLGYTS